MFTVTLLIFMIDTIVVYSMMMSDIEERTYEFAMLRCLGFENKSLITLITIQSLLYAIPATVAGFILL
jgi:ABC-type antimicrobial peptide transport system permease subunit